MVLCIFDILQIQKDLVLESARTQELLAQAERLVMSASIDDDDSEYNIVDGHDIRKNSCTMDHWRIGFWIQN